MPLRAHFECRLSWAGKKVRLRDNASILGRDPEVDVLIDMSNVSRRHARVVVDGAKATIEDLEQERDVRLRRSDRSAHDALRRG